MKQKYQFMVDFSLPEVLTEEFMQLIPYQRAAINRFFSEGKLTNYALSLENSRLWAVFHASTEKEVMDMITGLPLTSFMEVEISILTFYNTARVDVPDFSLN